MANLTIHAGDFEKGKGSIHPPGLTGGKAVGVTPPAKAGEFTWTGLGKHELLELAQIDVASEESVKRLGGTVGWGVVGGALLGPVGMLAGLLAGGRKKEVTFVAVFKDGRRMLATTDSATYTKLSALLF